METFEVRIERDQGIPVIQVSGYFNETTGQEINDKLDPLMKDGAFAFVLDLSKTEVINSPGLGKLLDITLKIIDDFKGMLFICGVDRLKRSVLTMIGVLPLARELPDRAQALEQARSTLPPAR